MHVPPPATAGRAYTAVRAGPSESAFFTPNFVSDDGPSHSGYMCLYFVLHCDCVHTYIGRLFMDFPISSKSQSPGKSQQPSDSLQTHPINQAQAPSSRVKIPQLGQNPATSLRLRCKIAFCGPFGAAQNYIKTCRCAGPPVDGQAGMLQSSRCSFEIRQASRFIMPFLPEPIVLSGIHAYLRGHTQVVHASFF